MMNNNILDKLKTPAVGLIVIGALNAVIGLLSLISGLMRLVTDTTPTFSTDAEKTGYWIGTIGTYLIATISLLLSPLIIFGAIKMMKGKSRGLAIASAILAILPISSCCFFIGTIFGIWALVVLFKPEVKEFFANGGNQPNFYPPQPPQNW
jgi:hypothetical protein